MRYADVAIGAPTIQSFTYVIPHGFFGGVKPGHRVAVPFRRRTMVGYVLGLMRDLPRELQGVEIKALDSVLDEEPVFSDSMLEWLKWLSAYYCAPIGEVCRTALPARLNQLNPPRTSRPTLPREMEHGEFSGEIVLTSDQVRALEAIRDQLAESHPKPILLHGITGSGKTEIYLKLFGQVKEQGRQAILLVPEIGLTPQLTSRVMQRFGERTTLYHSGLSDAQRHHGWERMRRGEVDVVVGTRSALFAPLPRLGAVVVDEEHDPSYKQDEGVLYHARDAAVMRGRMEGAVVVMGSATPSVESFANARAGKYHYIHLPQRTGGGALPHVEIVDMRHQKATISPRLIEAISKTLERGEQSMVFLNRRGFAHFLMCQDCGHTFRCPNCGISLTLHKTPHKLICHYCDYAIETPKVCPECCGADLVAMGRGTERVENELSKLFPQARIARLDRDTMSASATRTKVFNRMRRGEIDILVGTQMIAKGHDFPNITLVGIINADVSLHLPDFRSAERTFQLVTQVSGRAGRSGEGSRVILQTYQPENVSLRHACAHDYSTFFEEEQEHRQVAGYPPYARLANIRMSATDAGKAANLARKVARQIRDSASKLGLAHRVKLLGPAPAPMEKVRNRYRWQLMIKAGSAAELSKLIASVHPAIREFENRGLRLAVDIDPINMM